MPPLLTLMVVSLDSCLYARLLTELFQVVPHSLSKAMVNQYHIQWWLMVSQLKDAKWDTIDTVRIEWKLHSWINLRMLLVACTMYLIIRIAKWMDILNFFQIMEQYSWERRIKTVKRLERVGSYKMMAHTLNSMLMGLALNLSRRTSGYFLEQFQI